MAREDFIRQLEDLGYQVQDLGDNRISFPFTIGVGVRFYGMQIELGFEVPNDFPSTVPHGPHIRPQLLLPVKRDNSTHPDGGIHSSPFGADWEHWSRPHESWNSTDRTVETYMRHIRQLFKQ